MSDTTDHIMSQDFEMPPAAPSLRPRRDPPAFTRSSQPVMMLPNSKWMERMNINCLAAEPAQVFIPLMEGTNENNTLICEEPLDDGDQTLNST